MIQIFETLIRSNDAYQILARDYQKGNFNHAYILVSSDKAAQDLLLEQICMLIYCDSAGCRECAECKKIIKKSKPDIKVPNEEGQALKVEEIDQIISDTYLTAFEKGKKVYILKNLEKSSERVQNKLLKTLEEPNSNVHFFITASSLQGLLPTVVSRAKHINLSEFGALEMQNAIANIVEAERAEVIARCANGSLTTALRLMEDSIYFEKVDELIFIFENLDRSGNVVKYLNNPIFEDIGEAMDIVELIFHDLLLISNGIDTLTLKNREHILNTIAKKLCP